MGEVANGVGGVGRDGDASRGHDREVGDQPFGPVLADQRDAVSGLKPNPLECRRQGRDLPRRLGPACRAPRALALGPQKRLVALLIGARQEERNEIVEPFELPGHPVSLSRRGAF
jgi:hypothetical protein